MRWNKITYSGGVSYARNLPEEVVKKLIIDAPQSRPPCSVMKMQKIKEGSATAR